MKKLAIIIMAMVLAIMSACGVKKTQPAGQGNDPQQPVQSQAIDNTITYKGNKYIYNKELINILFMGIDKGDSLTIPELPGHFGQSDCLMLLSLDKSKQEGRVLQINRNAVTDIDFYTTGGAIDHTYRGQITLQYACGNGGTHSAWATKQKVREMLYGLPVDGYFVMDMEAIDLINDAIGGVDVTMKEDYTQIDPSFEKGATVHLENGLAEKFVRYRDCDEFNSVANRMERQVDYVTALIQTLRKGDHGKLYDILSPFLGDRVLTDMDSDQMNALSGYTYLTDQTLYLPGEMTMGEKYEEYIVDEDKLQELIIENYYKPVE